MVGPPQIGGGLSAMTQGLGLPNGQAAFNLAGVQGDAAPPQVQMGSFNPGPNTVGNGGFKVNITRTASSNPVQNIINDMQNPLGGTTIGLQQQAPPPPPPQLDAAYRNEAFHQQTLAPPGQTASQPWIPTMAPPGQTPAAQPRFPLWGLHSRMTWF